MRGRRGQRHHHCLIWLLLLTILGAGCGTRPTLPEEELHRNAALSLQRGNLVQAQVEIERGFTTWQDRPESVWHWNYRMLSADLLAIQGGTSDALKMVEPQFPNSSDLMPLEARWKTVRAGILLRVRRADEARMLLDDAQSIATRNGEKGLLQRIESLRGSMLAGRPAEAEVHFRSALKYAKEENDLYYQAAALNSLGFIRLRQFRYDEAITILEDALSVAAQGGIALIASAANTNIGICKSRLGDFDQAIASLNRAVEFQKGQGANLFLQATLGEIGNAYARDNELEKAIPHYRLALGLAREVKALRDASTWSVNLAVAHIEAREWDEAEAFNNQSIALKEEGESLVYSRLNAADIAAGRGQVEIAARVYEEAIQSAAGNAEALTEAHAGLGKLFRNSGDRQRASEHFETAIRTIEDKRAGWNKSSFRIGFLARLIRFFQEYVDALVDQREYDKALQVVESSRALVLSERLGFRRTPSSALFSDYRRVAGRSDATLLSYWLAPKRSFLWAVTPQKTELFILPPQQEIEQQVESYKTFIENLRDPLTGGRTAGVWLYETLVKPAAGLIRSGSNVVLVPDGALHSLNFETLPVAGELSRYWIEDVTAAIAPSLGSLLGHAPARAPKSILLIGDAESASPEFQRLPYANRELRQIEQRMSALRRVVYEGPRAQPEVYSAAKPGDFSIIHFAAHASAIREAPMDSAIILSPGSSSFKLYARDLEDQPLNADLVTISSCRSAGARVYSGEGLVGFVWAFLQAGARNVIAGLWDVNDASTAELMDNLYAGIAAARPPADALRAAKLTMIHSTGNFRKPYYWGPFQIYVGGTPNK